MGIPWSGIGASHWGFHGKLLWLAHGNQPMGIPWNGIGTSHVGIPGKLLWLAHGVPTQWAFHGMALVHLLGDSMASFYG